MRDRLVAAEDWDLLKAFFPTDWEQLSRTTHAVKGLRQDKSADHLLRTVMLHVGCGYSLRETAVRARESGLADLSDVALLKRLRKCEQWLYALAVGLWQQRGLAQLRPGQRIMRLIDATTVKEPGQTGSLWRIHYSLQVPSLRCDFFKVTANTGAGTGEGLWQIPVQRGEYLIADRGYSNNVGMAPVAKVGAYLTVRLNQGSVLLQDGKGGRLELLPKLQRLSKPGQVGSWKVFLQDESAPVAGRVCAIRKTRTAIEQAHRKIKEKARDESRPVNLQTLEYAKFVTVFTTFPEAEFSAREVLEWYRLRWQIELVFKRFKQIAALGHLPKYDEQSARAWLYGKLLVALLTEKLVQHANALSPWGYDGFWTRAQSVA
jgi:Transposase DDE domain